MNVPAIRRPISILLALLVVVTLHGLVEAPPGTRVACVLSGGNVDLEQLRARTWN